MFKDYDEIIMDRDRPLINLPNYDVFGFNSSCSSLFNRFIRRERNNPSMIARSNYFSAEENVIKFRTLDSGDILLSKSYIENKSDKFGFNYIGEGNKDDEYLYYDNYKGFVRLNISLKGGVVLRNSKKQGVVFLDGSQYDYRKIVEISKGAAKNREFDCIRLLIGHSAEGGKRSLIYNISRKLKMPVKGYIGGIFVYVPPIHDMEYEINQEPMYLGRAPLVQRFIDSSHDYSFSRPGKTVMAGMEYFWL